MLVLCAAVTACATHPASSPAPGQPDKLQSLAGQVENKGNPALAASLYEQAVQNHPSAINFINLGNARLSARQPAAAADAFRSALRLDEHNDQALLGLGKARLNQGEFDYAVRVLAPVAPRLHTADAWTQLGLASAGAGQPADAAKAFAQAAALSNDLDAQSNLALADSLAGEHSQALARMRAVCDSPLAEPRHFRNLLLVMIMANHVTEAHQSHMPGMSHTQQEALIRQALQIKHTRGAANQAREIGFIHTS